MLTKYVYFSDNKGKYCEDLDECLQWNMTVV